MKKAKLFGAIALMFALVLGAVSCKQDSTPSGKNVKDAIADGDDLSGTWKLTDADGYYYAKAGDQVVDEEFDTPQKLKDSIFSYMLPFTLDDDLCITVSNEELETVAKSLEKTEDAVAENAEAIDYYDYDFDWYFKVNDDLNEIYFYESASASYSVSGITAESKMKLDLTFTKQ